MIKKTIILSSFCLLTFLYSQHAFAEVNIFANGQMGTVRIEPNTAANITWTTSGVNPGTCSIAGPTAAQLFYAGGAVSNLVGISTGPLNQTSNYFLMCVNSTSSAVDVKRLIITPDLAVQPVVVPPVVVPPIATNTTPTPETSQPTTNNSSIVSTANSISLSGKNILYFPFDTTNSTSFFIGDGGRYSQHTSDPSPTNLTSYYNLGVGMRALQLNTTGSYNTALGFEAMNYNTTGSYNTALGEASMIYNISGNYNTGAGWKALLQNISGKENTAIGAGSMLLNTTGNSNTALGHNSLYYNTTGGYNTAIGNMSLVNSKGNYNAALGAQSMIKLVTGDQNLGIGFGSLYNLTTGYSNISIGGSSMYDQVSGNNNTVIGFLTGRGVKTGNNNTFIGSNISGLSEGLSNNIIISDGSGNKRFRVDATGNIYLTGPKICLNNTCMTEQQLQKLLQLAQ